MATKKHFAMAGIRTHELCLQSQVPCQSYKRYLFKNWLNYFLYFLTEPNQRFLSPDHQPAALVHQRRRQEQARRDRQTHPGTRGQAISKQNLRFPRTPASS